MNDLLSPMRHQSGIRPLVPPGHQAIARIMRHDRQSLRPGVVNFPHLLRIMRSRESVAVADGSRQLVRHQALDLQ